jgi:sugar lactone lactonase YvrE
VRVRKIAAAAVLAIALLAAYLLLWPVPVDPAAWKPPKAPRWERNSRLANVERVRVGLGPEDVAVDAKGRVYGGLADGRIVRVERDGTGLEAFAETGGRPAGLRFDAAGNLLVCDTSEGLLSVAPDGGVTALSAEHGGAPFRLTDDLDVAADGTVYFTDASWKFSESEYRSDVVEHRPNGRLLAYDPATGVTRQVLGDLYFANGVAVSPDQSFVLVAETSAYRVRRYWLAGPKKGQDDIFVDNLPGFPDGISSNGKGTFWLAIAAPRDVGLDAAMPYPFVRKIVMRLPTFVLPSPERYGFVLGLDAEGRVVQDLQDPTGDAYSHVTNVVEHDGTLYLGSLTEDAIGRLPAPAGP